MNSSVYIAILITVFNRRQKTIDCLNRLQSQQLKPGVKLEIFLTDDGSTDGTSEAVKDQFPDVKLYKGSGSLFWAGGMRFTWNKALASNADFYLLINDDTLLTDQAIITLLSCVEKYTAPVICVGSTVNELTGKTSYGGSRLTSKTQWKSKKIEAPTTETDCDFANANIMLVPKYIVNSLGILSKDYTHGLADYDYTLKAKKAGFRVVVAPGFLGSCVDDHGNNWKGDKVSLKERIKYLKSPKGLAYHEYLLFIRRHFPLSYPAAFFKLWLKTFFPYLWDTFKNQSSVNPSV